MPILSEVFHGETGLEGLVDISNKSVDGTFRERRTKNDFQKVRLNPPTLLVEAFDLNSSEPHPRRIDELRELARKSSLFYYFQPTQSAVGKAHAIAYNIYQKRD